MSRPVTMDAELRGRAAEASWAGSLVGIRRDGDDAALPSAAQPTSDDSMLGVHRDAVSACPVWGAPRSEAHRGARSFEDLGEPVLFVGVNGRAVRMNAAADRARGRLFALIGSRVTTMLYADQRRLDGIVTAARSHGRPGLIPVTILSDPGRAFVLAVPDPTTSREAVGQALAVVVFLETGSRPLSVNENVLTLLRDATGLTGREADVVRLIGAGTSPRQAAGILAIGLGTVRLHLKSAFAKCGVHSQSELATLIDRLVWTASAVSSGA